MCSTPVSINNLSDVFDFSRVSEDSFDELTENESSNNDQEREELSELFSGEITDDIEFKKDSEEYFIDNLADERFKMCKWVIDLQRKMRIMTELYKIQDQYRHKYITDMKKRNAANFEFINRTLSSILLRVRGQNANKKTSFVTLFDLNGIFKNFSSSIFLESAISEKFHVILDEWLNGFSFDKTGLLRIKDFLKLFYCASDTNLKTIYKSWKSSIYYSRECDLELRVSRNYIGCIYFSILKKSVDNALSMNLNFLPSLIDLGTRNLHDLLEILNKFTIPFSGPYKKVQPNGKLKIQLFISSCSIIDSISNCGLPLYGIFEFRSSCLRLRNDDAIKYINSLDTMPFWLNHMPPLFNKSLACLQQQIKLI